MRDYPKPRSGSVHTQHLWEVVHQPITPSLVFVFGPTGVGKTTLIERLAARLTAEDSSRINERDSHLPVLTVEAASPETGNFNWKGFYRESLLDEKDQAICRLSSDKHYLFARSPPIVLSPKDARSSNHL